MLVEERVRLLVFATAVVLVYSAAARLAWRAWRRRRGGAPPLRGERTLRAVAFALAACGLGCAVWARWIEPFRLDVTHVDVTVARWRGAPLRIVHVSDLHCDPAPRLEERLPEAIRAQHPDLIVFTGDAINSPAGLPVFRRCLAEIAAIAPTIAVRGNWDAWYWSDLDLFADTGAREVAGTSVLLSVRGEPVWIGGLAVGRTDELQGLVAQAPRDTLRILLHHYPDEVLRAAEAGVDLYLAGHTHGGQVALPFYGALVTLSRFGKRFESGLYRVGETWAYVNRGIGMEGGPAPRVRFCAPPEVTVIDVRGASG